MACRYREKLPFLSAVFSQKGPKIERIVCFYTLYLKFAIKCSSVLSSQSAVHISLARAAFASFPSLNGISKVSIRFSLKNKIKNTTVFSDNAFHILIRERITQLKEQEELSKLKLKLLPSKTSFF